MVMTATSRWATCESSCESTASTSGSSSRRSSPQVTQTTAFLGLRPVAKALGMSVVAMATCGLGMSASAQRRSTTPWSCGRLLGRDLLGVHGVHGDLGAEPVLAEQQDEADDEDEREGEADREQDADERAVEHDEEETRHEHAVGQAPVGLDVA